MICLIVDEENLSEAADFFLKNHLWRRQDSLAMKSIWDLSDRQLCRTECHSSCIISKCTSAILIISALRRCFFQQLTEFTLIYHLDARVREGELCSSLAGSTERARAQASVHNHGRYLHRNHEMYRCSDNIDTTHLPFTLLACSQRVCCCIVSRRVLVSMVTILIGQGNQPFGRIAQCFILRYWPVDRGHGHTEWK